MKGKLTVLAATAAALGLWAPGASAAAPSNDEPGAATTITALPFTETVDTVEATSSSDDPPLSCVGATTNYSNSVWYAFTPSADVELDANTLESDFDTVLAVFTGSPGALTEIGCSDQFAFSDQSRVDFTAKAGVTYYVLAAAWSAVPSGGSLRLTLQPSDGQAKPPVTSLALDPIGSVTPEGVATVSGTLFCEEELAFAFVRLNISQRVGKLVIRPDELPFGEGTWRTVDVACSPPSVRFSVDVVGDNGIFNAGTAHVDGQATACNFVTCSFPARSADIKLRRTKR